MLPLFIPEASNKAIACLLIYNLQCRYINNGVVRLGSIESIVLDICKFIGCLFHKY